MEENKENIEYEDNQYEETDIKEESDEKISEDDNMEVDENEESELDKVKKKALYLVDKYQKIVVEFDNFRNRTAKEKAGMHDDAVKDIIEKFLPVLDNFERAVDTAADKEDSFYKGVEMILKQFKDIMNSLNVEEIEAYGVDFDPNVHNAVMHGEDDKFGENKVSEVLQKGYKYKDKVIRPSMVKVVN